MELLKIGFALYKHWTMGIGHYHGMHLLSQVTSKYVYNQSNYQTQNLHATFVFTPTAVIGWSECTRANKNGMHFNGDWWETLT